MLETEVRTVAPISQARQALATVKTPSESKKVEVMALAELAWAKEKGDYEHVVEASETYILARCKTTELILPQIKQGRPSEKPNNDVKFLTYFNLTYMQWQRRRNEFEVRDRLDEYIADCIENSAVPTVTGLVRFASDKNSIEHVSDDSYEWFTPAAYIEVARLVMGGIDLDPASCQAANQVVKADRFYTQVDDGLAQSWAGRVWLNPPYNMPLIEDFIRRVTDEHEAGNVTAAIVLVNNSTDTGWFHTLLEAAPVVCLTRGRLKFWNGDERLAARQGQAIFYLGPDPDKFAEHFSVFGAALCKYDHSRP